MLSFVKTRTSNGRVLSEKIISDNWWGTYHDICVYDWASSPVYLDNWGNRVSWRDRSKKMVCVDRQRDVTVTLTKLDSDNGWDGVPEKWEAMKKYGG